MQFNLVYKTTNLINNKFYVGKHVQHDTSAFDGYLGSGLLITRAIEKYGKDNFIRETIEFCETEELAFEKEEYWVDCLSATNLEIGYNLFPGGIGLTVESSLKIRNNPQFKENHLNAMRELYSNLEFLEEIREKRKDPITRKKISNTLKNIWADPEQKKLKIDSYNTPQAKLNRSNANKGNKNPMCKWIYTLKSPSGEIFITDCISDFCREHGLIISAIHNLFSGRNKTSMGWTSVSKILKSEYNGKI